MIQSHCHNPHENICQIHTLVCYTTWESLIQGHMALPETYTHQILTQNHLIWAIFKPKIVWIWHFSQTTGISFGRTMGNLVLNMPSKRTIAFTKAVDNKLWAIIGWGSIVKLSIPNRESVKEEKHAGWWACTCSNTGDEYQLLLSAKSERRLKSHLLYQLNE